MQSQNTGLLVIYIVGMLAVAVAVAFYVLSRMGRKKEVYGARTAVDSEDYYTRYFSESGVEYETVKGVLESLNSSTSLDFSRVDPDEPFSRRISELLNPEDWVDLEFEIEEKFKLDVAELQPFETVRQLIHSVAILEKNE